MAFEQLGTGGHKQRDREHTPKKQRVAVGYGAAHGHAAGHVGRPVPRQVEPGKAKRHGACHENHGAPVGPIVHGLPFPLGAPSRGRLRANAPEYSVPGVHRLSCTGAHREVFA